MSAVVLVTGGAGFIGSHVVDRLAAAGYQPRILDTRPSPWHDAREVETVVGDILRREDVLRAMRGCSAVCHLAAAADVGEVHKHPAWATELNGTGTLNVLEAARELGIERVVYASTVWVYSDVVADEVDEETLLPQPAHLYTAGKLAGELFCRSYAELYGLQPTVLRFGIPYGPRARPAAVIPSFVDRALRGEALTIAGTGEQERSFVYVEDLAEGVVQGLAPHAAGRTYNLGGRETTTIRGLAEIVRDVVAPVDILHTEGRAGDLRGATVNSDRAERELGWRAATPLRDGVRRYAEWVREQDGQPVAASAAPSAAVVEADAAVPVPSRWGHPLRRLVAAAADPVYVGAAGLIAVVSAVLSVVLGTPDEDQATAFTVAGIALLAPLWSLTTAAWPVERRRAQAAAAALVAAFEVVLVGVLSAADHGDGDLRAQWVAVLVVVALAVSVVVQLFGRQAAEDSV